MYDTENSRAEATCTVALPSPPFASLTYAFPSWLNSFPWQPGLRVAVPLGNGRLRTGILLKLEGEELPEGVVPKPVFWPLEREPVLSDELLQVVVSLARRQAVEPGQILAAMLPSGLRLPRMRFRLQGSGGPRMFTLRELTGMTSGELEQLGREWLAGRAELFAPREDIASSELCVLQKDPPWPVRPAAKLQIAILNVLFEEGSVSRREILRRFGQGARQALLSLHRHGIVALKSNAGSADMEELLPPAAHSVLALSSAQQAALDSMVAELDDAGSHVHLLHGVTGSGKTVVYMELIRACLQRGRSVFLLAPEVALAMKLRRDVHEYLQDVPLFFSHGYQPAAVREDLYRQLAAREQPCVVVGTRSALFLPMSRLGAIILDEEHDASFKQDEGVNYQAKEVAWFRVARNRGILVLGSATPDLKTSYAARTGRISQSILPSRVGGGTLPQVRLVDLGTANMGESILAPETASVLKETVRRGEQAIILLNRRGYAPLMYCLDCGRAVRCPQCDIGMTYHKSRECLVCHYCGYSVPFPSPCAACRGLHFYPMGQGTERIEEYLGTLLSSRILRLDKDSTRRPGRMEEILGAFARQEAPVLVGTQMLSKGHHFPNVTLAIVADGDMGLNLPDYRAAERSFQLLVQSSGRAGRGEKPGQVLIQTRDMNHYCWKFVQTGDYEGFYQHEIALRRKRRYPPFTKLALLRISWPADWEQGMDELGRIAASLRNEGRERGVRVLGPAPSPIAMLRGRKRFQWLFKGDDWSAMRALYTTVRVIADKRHVRLTLDLDPVNMM